LLRTRRTARAFHGWPPTKPRRLVRSLRSFSQAAIVAGKTPSAAISKMRATLAASSGWMTSCRATGIGHVAEGNAARGPESTASTGCVSIAESRHDDVVLELGKRDRQVQRQVAGREHAMVQVARDHAELGTGLTEPGDEMCPVQNLSGQAVEPINHDAIDRPGLDPLEELAERRPDERCAAFALVVEAVAEGDPTLIRALPDELTARLALSIARGEVGIARADDRLPRVDGAPHHTPSHLANLSRPAGRHVRGVSFCIQASFRTRMRARSGRSSQPRRS
jgi:hypothetical protein